MRKIIALFVEEIFIIFSFLLLFILYAERLMSIITGLRIVSAIVLAVIIAKIIEAIIDIRLRKLESDPDNIIFWRLQYLYGFGLVWIDFYAVFIALEYYGWMPISSHLLLVVSINTAALHMLISSLLDLVVDL